MNPKQISFFAFFSLLILISLQLLGVFRLFLIPILWAVILAIVVFPFYRWVLSRLRGRKTIASLLVTIVVLIVTTGPMTFFSGTLVKEILDFSEKVVFWIRSEEPGATLAWLSQSPLGGVWEQIRIKTATLNIQIVPLTVKFLENISNTLAGQVQAGAKNFLVFLFDYFIMIFSLFFFLRDGEGMARAFHDLFPMSAENKRTVFGGIEKTLSAVVRGVLATGITQGILAGLAFWILGVPYPLFLGLLTAFLAFVPLGGAAAVWIPSAAYLYFQGDWGKGLGLALWGLLVISMVDNFLKPLLIGGETRLPTLFLFFAILGGLSYYGFIGVFIGPVLLALFLTLIQIYRKDYAKD